jgi:uncharacterized protein YoxC
MADTDTGAKPVDQDALIDDIDRTRAELARTIDAISDRVSPSKNIQRAWDQASKNVQWAMGQVRQRASQIDPLIAGAAAAAVVLGATALFLWRRQQH